MADNKNFEFSDQSAEAFAKNCTAMKPGITPEEVKEYYSKWVATYDQVSE